MDLIAPAKTLNSPQSLVACGRCGSIQSHGGLAAALTLCHICGAQLERRSGRSLGLAFAGASATLLLLFPANLLPILSTSLLGSVQQSWLISSVAELWREGWPPLALAIGLVVIVLPFVRFGLLTLVLGALHTDWRPNWLGPAFRIANALQTWAMVDVCLLGLWIAYSRLEATLPTYVETGGVSLIAAGLLALFTRAALNQPAVWRLIRPQPVAGAAASMLSCLGCGHLHPADMAGASCPRCRAGLVTRKPGTVARATALALAGALLYLPANLLPMATVPIALDPSSYTVLQGVGDLAEARLYALALLVFTASFAIPILKLVGLAWIISSVLTGSGRRLLLKSRLYTLVEEIGRWSMVDPLVIACFVPVMQFNTKLYGRAEPAALAFTAVVLLTMLATHAFDPRTLWDPTGAHR